MLTKANWREGNLRGGSIEWGIVGEPKIYPPKKAETFGYLACSRCNVGEQTRHLRLGQVAGSWTRSVVRVSGILSGTMGFEARNCGSYGSATDPMAPEPAARIFCIGSVRWKGVTLRSCLNYHAKWLDLQSTLDARPTYFLLWGERPPSTGTVKVYLSRMPNEPPSQKPIQAIVSHPLGLVSSKVWSGIVCHSSLWPYRANIPDEIKGDQTKEQLIYGRLRVTRQSYGSGFLLSHGITYLNVHKH